MSHTTKPTDTDIANAAREVVRTKAKHAELDAAAQLAFGERMVAQEKLASLIDRAEKP